MMEMMCWRNEARVGIFSQAALEPVGAKEKTMASWEEYKTTMQRPANLWDAARSNDPAALGQLLDEGAALEARDARGYSALMLAAYGGNAEAFDYLLARGADPNSADLAGNTVLMGASFKGHLELVRKLLDRGADLLARNSAGMDAVGFANTFGRTEVEALLRARANPASGGSDDHPISNR